VEGEVGVRGVKVLGKGGGGGKRWGVVKGEGVSVRGEA